MLFEQGTMGDCIYVVSEGEIELIRELAGGGEELLKVAAARRLLRRDRPAVPSATVGDRAGAHRCDGHRLHRAAVPGTARRRRGSRHHRTPRHSTTEATSRVRLAGTRLSSTSGPIGSTPSNRQRCALAMVGTPTSSIDGDRSAEQDRRHVGQDPVDHPGPQERPGQRRSALEQDVGAVRQRLDHLVRIAGADHHGPRVVVENFCFRGDFALTDDHPQRLALGQAAVGQPRGQRRVVGEHRAGADDDRVGSARRRCTSARAASLVIH